MLFICKYYKSVINLAVAVDLLAKRNSSEFSLEHYFASETAERRHGIP